MLDLTALVDDVLTSLVDDALVQTTVSKRKTTPSQGTYVTPNTTGTSSQLSRLLLLLRLRRLNGISRPSDCGPGCACGSTIPSMKKTPARC
jgi:hypothetical protein